MFYSYQDKEAFKTAENPISGIKKGRTAAIKNKEHARTGYMHHYCAAFTYVIWQTFGEKLTTGSESLAVTVVTMVPLTALGATMPLYRDCPNTGEKSFMSCRGKIKKKRQKETSGGVELTQSIQKTLLLWSYVK